MRCLQDGRFYHYAASTMKQSICVSSGLYNRSGSKWVSRLGHKGQWHFHLVLLDHAFWKKLALGYSRNSTYRVWTRAETCLQLHNACLWVSKPLWRWLSHLSSALIQLQYFRRNPEAALPRIPETQKSCTFFMMLRPKNFCLFFDHIQ